MNQENQDVDLASFRHSLGQSLAALRVDATWLAQSGRLEDPARAVLSEMLDVIVHMQDQVRRLPDAPEPRA